MMNQFDSFSKEPAADSLILSNSLQLSPENGICFFHFRTQMRIVTMARKIRAEEIRAMCPAFEECSLGGT